jgi:L-malate glycosyltransferase
VLKLYKNAYRFGRYLMARRVLRHAKAITAVSDDLKRRIAPLACNEISVVPNPLSRQFIDAGSPRTAPSDCPNPKLISVINGWGYLKNASSTLIAFSYIRRQLKDVTYHFYGIDFQPGGPAEQWAKSQGLAQDVVFHGPVSHGELVIALKDATLMLHPSRSESCPMGIAEALALGLPVVGGVKSGGVPWMIGEAGLLVDIDKPLEIAHAALQLLTDDVLYEKFVTAAVQRVKAFSPELIAAQYEEIYMHILEQAGTRQCN